MFYNKTYFNESDDIYDPDDDDNAEIRKQTMDFLDIFPHFHRGHIGKFIFDNEVACNNNYRGGDCYGDTYNLLTGTDICTKCGITFCCACCLTRCPVCAVHKYEGLNLEYERIWCVWFDVLWCGELSHQSRHYTDNIRTNVRTMIHRDLIGIRK